MTTILRQSSTHLDQHVTLEGVTWQTYQSLLRELRDHRASRLAFDQGVLEITVPSDFHELINRLLEAIIRALTEELDMKLRGYGSTTIDREDLQQGIEPDSCFYIQRVEQILGRKLDFQIDPPPDLAVEVDISSSSQRRFGIYLQLQVPEVWRYIPQQGVSIYCLENGKYSEVEFSPAFPIVSGEILANFLKLADTQDDAEIVRRVRRWLREQQSC